MTVKFPWVAGATFVPDETEKRAAWSLYVEHSTRGPIAVGDPEYSSARETLSSIYSLFGETRRILRESGPGIARGSNSLAPLVLGVLNHGIRPFLTKWHSELKNFEVHRPESVDSMTFERAWPKLEEFWEEMEFLRTDLEIYCHELLTISGARVGEENARSDSA